MVQNLPYSSKTNSRSLEALDFADKIVFANLTNNIFKAYELPSDIFHIGAVSC